MTFCCSLYSFLRSVGYRQFTRMVHGRLRERRIALPACAYAAIRRAHKAETQTESFVGYQDLELEEESHA